jgi:hypothetical protein
VRIAPWARRATLISAWIWLCIMLFGVAVIVIGLVHGGMHIGRGEMIMAAVVGVPLLAIALGLPILLIAQFTRPGVRATFERGRQTS